MLQGLRSLEMANVVGAYPTETEELLSALRGLTALRIRNNTAAVKMAPMHCLSSMPLLQVPRPVSTLMHAALSRPWSAGALVHCLSYMPLLQVPSRGSTSCIAPMTDDHDVEAAIHSMTGVDASRHWTLRIAGAACSTPARCLVQDLCWMHPFMTAVLSLQELTLSETLHAVLPGLARLSMLTDLRCLRLNKVCAVNIQTGSQS